MNPYIKMNPVEIAYNTKRLIFNRHYNGDKEDNCSICLDQLINKMLIYLPCKHTFHYKCFQQLIERRKYTCPLCRDNFTEPLKLVGIYTIEPDITTDGVNNTGVNNTDFNILIFSQMSLFDFMTLILILLE